MTTSLTFDIAIDRVLGIEGGYSNDPDDPGGETNWGVTLRTARANGYTGNMIDMTRADAKGIYKTAFWDPVVATVTSPALQYQVLDAAVNHGMGNAVRMLQNAAGVAQDGGWGKISREALAKLDPNDAHLLFMAARFEFWASLAKFDKYGRGWTRRGAKDLRYLAQDN